MNKIQITIAAPLVALSMASSVFAAEETKPVVPAPPVVASQQPANDAAAKSRAARLRQRNMKAKSVSETEKKTVVPVEPAAETPAVSTVPPKTPAADASAAKRVNKLKERNMKARTRSLPKETAIPKDKEATPTAK